MEVVSGTHRNTSREGEFYVHSSYTYAYFSRHLTSFRSPSLHPCGLLLARGFST